MDWKAVSEAPTFTSFSYFSEVVDCPFISPFDQANWLHVKIYIANLGLKHSSVADILLTLQALHRSQVHHLSITHASASYQSALSKMVTTASEHTTEFDVLLVKVFLLCLCAVTLPNEEQPHLSAFEEHFPYKLETWLMAKHCSNISLRICAWLQLVSLATKRPGSPGLFPTSALDLLYDHVPAVPVLSVPDHPIQPEHTLHDAIATPIFNFYLHVQRISNRVADVTHYRRSRTTSADQEEVSEILTSLIIELHSLWDNRPGPLQLQPATIRQHFSSSIADKIITLSGLCIAAFHTEIISIGRIMGDPPFPSAEATEARHQIRQLVDNGEDWNGSSSSVTRGDELNPGYTRPLFMYGLESFDKHESEWAVAQLRRIRHPLNSAGFLASFLEAHGEAQRAQSRRVTMKYFCLQTFRVPLPFM